MPASSAFIVRTGALALAGLLCAGQPALAADSVGSFGLITDFHLDPFDPPELAAELATAPVEEWPTLFATISEQAMSSWGKDTNYALFVSSLEAFAKSAAATDFVIVPGDFLAHEFEKKAAAALGADSSKEKISALAIGTTEFIGNSLSQTFPDKPVILALGNNDSDCGDYEITPGGQYLAGTMAMVRRLAGPQLLAPDFEKTYAAGGYYAVKHPGLPETLILVVNDVLWSAKYQDACGSGGEAAAHAMMDWLRDNLARQKEAGGAVWLVHHIPWGIDPYSTVHSDGATCEERVVPFLREPYADGFIELLRDYRDIVDASYSGHVHTDDYRLLVDEKRNALGLQKIPPAISPIYNQNPGFEIVSYDLTTGAPIDFSTYYLTNLDSASLAVPGDWQFEYTFTSAYGLAEYTADSVHEMVRAVEAGGAAAETYRRLYVVSHGMLPEEDLTAYTCAMKRLKQEGFTRCYCGE